MVNRCKFCVNDFYKLLNNNQRVLNNIFFEELGVIGKISIRRSKNKQRTTEKIEILKSPMVNWFI